MSTSLFVVIAGNIVICDSFEDEVPNSIEVFSTPELAHAFGATFDYYTVTEKVLDIGSST